MGTHLEELWSAQEPDEKLEKLKIMVEKDLKTVIEGGKLGKRDYIWHFYHDLRGCKDHACPYCHRYFADSPAMTKHKKKHETSSMY